MSCRKRYDLPGSNYAGLIPTVIITVIHGTFQPDAAWTERGSEFRQRLERHLHGIGRVYIRRLRWTGRNNLFDRHLAGEKLARDADRVRLRFPESNHIVVAHSHAGNFALQLLSERKAHGVNGIACLATPFFHLRVRDELTDGTALMRSWASVLLLLSFIYFASVAPPAWLIAVITLASILIGQSIGAFLGGGFDAVRPGAEMLTDRTRLVSSVPVLNLRAAGDEAAFALSFGQMLDWISHSLHRRVVARSGSVRATILPGRWTIIGAILALATILSGLVALTVFSLGLTLNIAEPAFRAIGTVTFLLTIWIKTRWLDNLLLGALTVASICSTIFSSIWFGTKLPSDFPEGLPIRWLGRTMIATLLEVRTEAAPVGKWGIQFLPPAPSSNPPGAFTLTHSIYNHPDAARTVANWVRECTR
jgi:hypothetical protein